MQSQDKQQQDDQVDNESVEVNIDSSESVDGSHRQYSDVDSNKKQQQNRNESGVEQVKLSKKQLKKQQRRQKFQQIIKQKRKQQRQKQKQKKRQKKQEEGIQEVKEDMGQMRQIKMQKKRKQEYQQKMLDSLKVVIDLQFYDAMTDKEKSSLGKQLAYCHSVNRKMDKCFHFILTSATCNHSIQHSEDRVKFLHEKYHINHFGITILQPDILNSFNKEKIVYLTGDAEEQLTEFHPQEVYVIGGIVDHNRLKRITIDYANKVGIKAKRLPMEGLKLKACVHLAVNHVWEWMLRFYNGSTWRQALKAVIPQRKLQEQQVQEQLINKELLN